MKNLKIKSLFLGLLVAASLALTACGGGTGDSGGASDVNPSDGVVTQTEASSIRAGMNNDQVIAILGAPRGGNSSEAEQWNGEPNNGKATSYQIRFVNGVPTWLTWYENISGINLSITKIPA